MIRKPNARNWNDIQMLIATLSLALTLGFWNLFAGPDRETAAKKAAQTVIPTPTSQPPGAESLPPTLLPAGIKILLGGAAPLPPAAPQQTRRRGNNGGGGAVTTTRSS